MFGDDKGANFWYSPAQIVSLTGTNLSSYTLGSHVTLTFQHYSGDICGWYEIAWQQQMLCYISKQWEVLAHFWWWQGANFWYNPIQILSWTGTNLSSYTLRTQFTLTLFRGHMWLIWNSPLAATDVVLHLKTMWVLAHVWWQVANFWYSPSQILSWTGTNGPSNALGSHVTLTLFIGHMWLIWNSPLAATDVVLHLKTVWVFGPCLVTKVPIIDAAQLKLCHG
jgi:hypothetical protein